MLTIIKRVELVSSSNRIRRVSPAGRLEGRTADLLLYRIDFSKNDKTRAGRQ